VRFVGWCEVKVCVDEMCRGGVCEVWYDMVCVVYIILSLINNTSIYIMRLHSHVNG
jgi:hypothetical protein